MISNMMPACFKWKLYNCCFWPINPSQRHLTSKTPTKTNDEHCTSSKCLNDVQ